MLLELMSLEVSLEVLSIVGSGARAGVGAQNTDDMVWSEGGLVVCLVDNELGQAVNELTAERAKGEGVFNVSPL